MALPAYCHFEGIGMAAWAGPAAFRRPLKGEYYLSGAIIAGYLARADLDSAYYVVKPTHHAKRAPGGGYDRGDPIVFGPRGALPRQLKVWPRA